MKDAPSSRASTVVNHGGVSEDRTDRCGTHCGTEEQENMLPVLLAILSGH